MKCCLRLKDGKECIGKIECYGRSPDDYLDLKEYQICFKCNSCNTLYKEHILVRTINKLLDTLEDKNELNI